MLCPTNLLSPCCGLNLTQTLLQWDYVCRGGPCGQREPVSLIFSTTMEAEKRPWEGGCQIQFNDVDFTFICTASTVTQGPTLTIIVTN